MKSDMEETAKSIRKIVLGTIIAEYGLLEMKDQTRHELKQLANNALTAIKRFQNYFITHENCSQQTREAFKKEFLKNETFMLSELLEAVWGLSEDDLEIIINTIKENTDVTDSSTIKNNQNERTITSGSGTDSRSI